MKYVAIALGLVGVVEGAFLEVGDADVLKMLKDCQSGKVEVCQEFQAKKNSYKADNGYCATYSPQADLGPWKERCKVSPPCHTKKKSSNCIEVLSFPSTLVNFMFENSGFPPDLIKRIGDGLRRKLMDPAYNKWHACQTWSQVASDDGQYVLLADAWGYNEEGDTCLLYNCSNDEPNPEDAEEVDAFAYQYC